jgi:hypothetical protein
MLSSKPSRVLYTGKTKNISVDGACIVSPMEPELQQGFTIVLKPPGAKSIPVIAKLVWSDNLEIDDKAVFGMGIRFMAISPEDRQYIAAVLEQNRGDQPF